MPFPELLEEFEFPKGLNLTAGQLLAYDHYLDAIRTEATINAEAFKKGWAEGYAIGLAEGYATGLAIGRAEALKFVATNLKNAGQLTTQQITDITDLSEEEINLL